MMRIAVLVLPLATLFGCGGSKDSAAKPETAATANAQGTTTSNDPLDFAIAGLGEWKTKMCACKDLACADNVHEQYKTWERDVVEPMFKDKKIEDLPKDKIEIAEKLDDERKACRRNLRGKGSTIAEAMAKMAEFRDMMCACKDDTCAKRVSDEMTRWSKEEASKSSDLPRMNEDEQKAAIEIGTQMGECMQKAMGM